MTVTKRDIKAMAANCLNRMAHLMEYADAIESRIPRGRTRFKPHDAPLLRRRAARFRKAYFRLHSIAAGQ